VDHSKHKFEFLNKAGEKHKAAMKSLLQKANARGPSLQTSVVAVDQAVDAVNKRAASDRAFVSEQIHHYMKALKDREDMLLAEVESVRHKHESTLQAKKHDLEVALAVVRSGCEFVEKALQAGGDAELMAMRGTVTCHMKELIQPVGAEAKLETISETTLPRTDMEEDRKALSDAIQIFGATPGGVSVVKERNQLKAELERLKAELKQAALNSDKEVQRLKNELEQQKRTSDNLRTQVRPLSYHLDCNI
jgi:regulator of replication initiation timing